MKAPYLNEYPLSRDMIEAFAGLDRRARIGENAFAELENLSPDLFPAIGVRKKRKYLSFPTVQESYPDIAPVAVCGAPDGIVWVGKAIVPVPGSPARETQTKYVLCKNDEALFACGTSGRDPAQIDVRLIPFGTRYLMLGANYYYDTATDAYGELSWTYSSMYTSDFPLTYTLCKPDGSDYDTAPAVSPDAPASPSDGDLWIDTSSTQHILKEYSAGYGLWQSIATSYVRVQGLDIHDLITTGSYDMREGDAVKLHGIPPSVGQFAAFNDKYITVEKIIHDPDTDANCALIFAGLIEQTVSSTQAFTVSKEMPVMDLAFACGNRLWGCRYGENKDGDFVNEIYASALGDCTSWFNFRGISTDSWIASVGADGPFTGGIAFNGAPHFFKEDRLIRVYGDYPAQFRTDESGFVGVQNGAAASLCESNHLLYYKAPGGVYVYDGAFERRISDCLGENFAPQAAAGAYKDQYLILMKEKNGPNGKLYAYDAAKAQWYAEDAPLDNVRQYKGGTFASYGDGLLSVSKDVNGMRTLFAVLRGEKTPPGAYETTEERVPWRAQTGDIGMTTPDQKTPVRMNVRLRVSPESSVSFYVQYDSTEPWQHIATINSTKMKTFSLPIRIKRCDHFKLRMEGKGHVVIYSISKILEAGSALP